jgi:phosphohistidine phosphatase SixA
MRHAEKPDDTHDPDLTAEGRARAQSLASYIPATFGKPDFLFASSPSKHSRRPVETIQPLAAACGLSVDESYADQDYGALAHDLRKNATYDGRVVVVCWHHGNIPNMLHALNVADGGYPDPWNRDVFDLILRVELDDAAAPKVTEVTEPF